jgi:hypothetical protein
MTNLKINSELRKSGWWFYLVIPALLLSCHKTKIEPVDVYPDPPAALVKFLDGNPNPSIGTEGSEVVFKVTGLKDKTGQFEFFINQTKAEILAVTENSVTVKIPKNSSTGGSSILINNEYYFGPTFNVRGKVMIDPTFNPDLYRSNGPIYEMRDWDGSNYVISGSFTNYQNQANTNVKIPGVAILVKTSLAYKDVGAATSQFKIGKDGIAGTITTVVPVDNGKYIVAGAFSQYDTIKNVNSITRINQNGTVDSMLVDIIGTPPLDQAWVPAFNGGVMGNAGKVFYNETTKNITVIGNFFSHVSTFYERSSIDGFLYDYVKTKQLVRMKENGKFDSSFNYNFAAKESYAGANGTIYDAIQLDNGDFLAVGNFTTFHNKAASHIVRINGTDGSVNTTFMAGADGDILRVVQNKTTKNILVTGNFKTYNGQAVNGVVMISETGQIIPTFKFDVVDGIPNFAGQMNNGKIIVSGSFSKYGSITREGLLILNADGTLAAGYNNTGLFRGVINNFKETTTSTGIPAIILYGQFDRFDNREVGNIVKFRMEN